jgi:Cu+-exporting ATPase
MDTPIPKNQHITLPIYNLSCGGGGSLTIERVLARTSGVVEVYVNPATEMAYITYDPEQSSPEQLAIVIKRAGFGPRRS